MEQLPGFINPSSANHVYKLNKAIYGLKQAHKLGLIASVFFSFILGTFVAMQIHHYSLSIAHLVLFYFYSTLMI